MRCVDQSEIDRASHARDPGELLQELRPHLASYGITRIANITGLDTIGIPVTLVVRPNSRSMSVSQGKGVTLAHAKASGVMESIEQFHAERPRCRLALATYDERRASGPVVDLESLPRVRPVSAHDRILWVTALEFFSNEPCDVPFELVHLDLRVPVPEGSGFFPLSSNGLASGSSLVEAVAHGVWEVIERDALSLFYRRSPEEQFDRRVRVESIDDPVSMAMLACFERAGLGAAVWDMTTDLGVACLFCSVGVRTLDPLRRVGTARGFGCHPDRRVALRRALTEAAQSRLTRIAGSRDDLQAADIEAIRSPESIEVQIAHLSQEAAVERQFARTPSFEGGEVEAALEWTRQRLTERGYDKVLCVELSDPKGPVAIARSIIPGLEGFPEAPGLLPGARAREVEDSKAL